MDTPRFRHKVERTRNKHSRAVYRGNTIIIRLAKNLSRTEEQDHIRNLLRRMAHLILLDREKTLIDPFRALLAGASSTKVQVGRRKVMFSLRPGDKTKAVRVRGGWRVDVSPGIRRRTLHRFLWSLLADDAEAHLVPLLHKLNKETYRAKITQTKVAFATTQWGSCAPRGRIMLNTALVFLPPRLQRYVIIHELAHTRRADHSAAYWREVEAMLPHYAADYKELHQHRLPTL
jgi:predicted metal-dependent hydrolase